jgi:hypothetical protein
MFEGRSFQTQNNRVSYDKFCLRFSFMQTSNKPLGLRLCVKLYVNMDIVKAYVICQSVTSREFKLQRVWSCFMGSSLLLLLTLQPFVCFSLLHQFTPGLSVFNEICPVPHFSVFTSFSTSSFHLFLELPLVLIPVAFHSEIFLTAFVSLPSR